MAEDSDGILPSVVDLEDIMFGVHPEFGQSGRRRFAAHLDRILSAPSSVSPEFGKQLDQLDQDEGELT